MLIRSAVGTIFVCAVLFVAPNCGAQEPPSLAESDSSEILEPFRKHLKFFGQEPLLTAGKEDLVFRVTSATEAGYSPDRFFRIDFSPHGKSTITTISMEVASCSPNAPGVAPANRENDFQADWVRREFRIETALLKDFRNLIESSEFRSSSARGGRIGFDGADYLFEARWPDGHGRTIARWSPEDGTVFDKLLWQTYTLMQTEVALDSSAVKARESVRACQLDVRN